VLPGAIVTGARALEMAIRGAATLARDEKSALTRQASKFGDTLAGAGDRHGSH
jgi:hypothetical protein